MPKIHGKNCSIYIKQFKLTGDANNVSIEPSVDTADTTSFEDTYKQFLEGVAGFSGSIDYFWNSAVDAIDEETQALIGNGVFIISIYPTGDTVANVGYAGQAHLVGDSITTPIAGAVTLTFNLEGHQELNRVILLEKATRTANGNSAIEDYGAAGTDKITAFLHVTAFSGFSTVTVKVEMDTAVGFSTPTDAVTFAAITGITSERKQSAIAGEQFLRVNVAVTGSGSITLVVGADNL